MSMTQHSRKHVVTAFIRGLKSKYLLVQRSDTVGSYCGYWGGISGGMELSDEGDALGRAYVEIEEEVGFMRDDLVFVGHGRPLLVDDASRHFFVMPFLFDLIGEPLPEPRLNWENVQARFYTKEEMKGLQTVPLLVETLERVVHEEDMSVLVDDREHGAAELCLIALDHLRQIASKQCYNKEVYVEYVRNAAWHMAGARENMAPVANGIALVLAEAGPRALKSPGIESARDIILDSIEGQKMAVRRASGELVEQSCKVIGSLVTDGTCLSIMTLSLSSTVTRVIGGLIKNGISVRVIVCESRPLCEGVVAAKQFHEMGADAVTIITDAQIASYVGSCDIALCGADSLTARGFVNKVGTRSLATLARQSHTRMVVLSDLIKCCPGSVFDVVSGKKIDEFQPEEKDAVEVTDVWVKMGLLHTEEVSSLTVCNRYFEETPYELADMIISSKGVLDENDIQEYIENLKGVYASAFVHS